jgi:DNA-binding beta-propeller fold protein YncE
MRLWGLGAVIFLTAVIAGCGGNSTALSVTISGPSQSPITVLINNSVQFAANVTSGTVTWQVCLPPASTASGTPPPPTTKPTVCTPIPGVTPPKGTTVLTGYGTITTTGLYTAPSTVPTPNTAFILAVSTADATEFGTFTVNISSGIVVTVSPTTATLGPLEMFQFTANVTGTTNNAVSWSLSGSTTGPALGTISASGLYTAPGISPGSVTVTAQSAADSTKQGTATVTIGSGGPPVLTSLDPTTAVQGSAQQDVYLIGSNFESTSVVVVVAPNQPQVTLAPLFITSTLLRLTLPANLLGAAGAVSFEVESGMNVSATLPLTVFPVRPALVASSPESVPQNSAGASVGLTGGYFSSATTATVNGSAVAPTLNSSRQLSVAVPAGSLIVPGLYPIVVQNSGVALGEPSLSALNLAVTPIPSLLPGAPSGGPIGVGTGPTAVAIDEADGIAVVANTGANSVTLVNVTTGATEAINVGTPNVLVDPTGVAVDDLLSDPVALVVSNADQTVTAIDLTACLPISAATCSPSTTTLSVSIASGTNPPLPFSIGVNPITDRAVVAYQRTNEATVLDVSVAGGTPAISVVQQIGGGLTGYSTGTNPAIAIDPRLNWALITPGGAGIINIVDLGLDVSTGEPNGRAPQVMGTLSLSIYTQGVGINPETHQALLTDPQGGTLATFSLLDNTVTPVTIGSTLPGAGGPVNQVGFGAAAADALENVGIAVNTITGTAAIVDLGNSIVLQTVTGVGTSPQAVAIDPISNQAVVVNQGSNNVALVSLGPAIDPLQIVEASPAITYTSATPLTLTVTGGNFPTGSVVRLDQVALATTAAVARTCTATAPVTCRQLTAMVPASMLGSARRYILDVQNPANGAVSNVTDLTVIQAVSVGNAPVGVAVDTDRDLAVATNSGDGTLSLISLAPISAESPLSLGPIGLIGSAVLVGTTPAGVAVSPRLGLAVVANSGSNNSTVVDVTGTNSPVTVGSCSGCTAPVGVAVNQDTATAGITYTNPTGTLSAGTVGFFSLPATPMTSPAGVPVDHDPVAIATDPNLDYAAVATASQTSSVEFVDMAKSQTEGRSAGSGLQDPSGVIFDPVNQVFLVANSLLNNVVIIDPTTFIQTPLSTGIAPTSLDYNYQTSTLVTVNSPSRTMSVLSYVCPPASGASACVGSGVRTVLGVGGTQTSIPVLGPNAVAIDPKLNLAVLVDPDNNRILLVPLPH